jgi:hypothetical protein
VTRGATISHAPGSTAGQHAARPAKRQPPLRKAAFGSESWLEKVFSGSDAREVWGRSRPTQRYAIAGMNGKPVYAEGGNESTARALMVMGKNSGTVKRWKFQPFNMTAAEFGVEAVPDLIFQLYDERAFVVEARSARFQTPEKLRKAQQVEAAINATGTLKYLYWTDAWPLTPSTTSLVREMRRCGTSDIPKHLIAQLQELLESGPKTLFELREMVCFRDVVMAAVWHGKAHLDMFSPVTDLTLVTPTPETRRFQELLHLGAAAQTWWSSLARA